MGPIHTAALAALTLATATLAQTPENTVIKSAVAWQDTDGNRMWVLHSPESILATQLGAARIESPI